MTLSIKDPLKDRIITAMEFFSNHHESVYVWKLKKATFTNTSDNFMEEYNQLITEGILKEVYDTHGRLKVRLMKNVK